MLTPSVIKVFWVLPVLLLSTAVMFVGFSILVGAAMHSCGARRARLVRHMAGLPPALQPLFILRRYRQSRICVFAMKISGALATSAVVMSILAAILTLVHAL